MPTPKINNQKDILLLLLYSPGVNDGFNEPIEGRTRIVKMLFLFKEEFLQHFKKGTDINEDNFYQFFPWDFGPFSTDVYDDIVFFELRGFIERKNTSQIELPEVVSEVGKWQEKSGIDYNIEYDNYQEDAFYLTKKGKEFVANKLYILLSTKQKESLKIFKSRYINAPLRAILRYVYSNYPDFIAKSKIKKEVLF